MVTFNADANDYTQAIRYDELRQVWWSFASADEDAPEHILVMQRNPDGGISWAKWNFSGVNVFGLTRNAESLLLDDVYQTWDEIDWAWDDPTATGGYPRVLVGKRNGEVWISSSQAHDGGDDITFTAKTQRLSPYPGKRTRFGYVDVQADAVDGQSVTFTFSKDFAPESFGEFSMDLSPEGNRQKVVRRIPINAASLFLEVNIEYTGQSPVNIDFLNLWAKPIGRMREV